MRRFVIRSSVVVLTAVLGFFVSAAQGVPVVSDNTTTVFASNGFEDDTVGSVPMMTTVGSWSVHTPSADSMITVENASSPDAAFGAKYLRMYKASADASKGNGALQVLGSPAAAGDNLEAEYSIYLPSSNPVGDGLTAMTNFLTANVEDGTTVQFLKRVTWFGYCMDPWNNLELSAPPLGSLGVDYYNGSWNEMTRASDHTPMYVSADAWHSVTVDLYSAGTPNANYTVTIDGILSDPVTCGAGTVQSFGYMCNQSADQGDHVFYIDGANAPVPEPSTLSLLVTGLLGLLTYAWQRRK